MVLANLLCIFFVVCSSCFARRPDSRRPVKSSGVIAKRQSPERSSLPLVETDLSWNLWRIHDRSSLRLFSPVIHRPTVDLCKGMPSDVRFRYSPRLRRPTYLCTSLCFRWVSQSTSSRCRIGCPSREGKFQFPCQRNSYDFHCGIADIGLGTLNMSERFAALIKLIGEDKLLHGKE